MTPFAAILEDVVRASPHAIGGAFAAADGEMVDAYSTIDHYEFAVLTAHYGVILALLDSALGTQHYGGPEYFLAQHTKLDVLVHTVHAGYYALVAYSKPPNLNAALEILQPACKRLRKEMM